MFRLGRSRFYRKIKNLLKLSKTRVDTIIKKRNTIHKYLKNDVAELLSNGLDRNAYGRAEGLLVELNMLSCCNFIEQCIGRILANLAAMESQRECPNECREAAQSLMHAAARFADMPELRELRTVFTERYGNSLEPFLNKEFAEKLRSCPPTKEKKLQLLQDIAQEYSIPFDPASLERQTFKPPSPAREKTKLASANDAGYDGYNHQRTNDDALSESDGHNKANKMSNLWEKPKRVSAYDAEDDGSTWHRRKDDAFPERDGHKMRNNVSNLREQDVPKQNEEDLRYRGKKGFPDDGYNIPCSSEDEVLANDRSSSSSSHGSRQSSSSSVGSFYEEEVQSRKPCYYGSIPPPYVKQKDVNKSNGSVNAEQKDQSQPISKCTLKPPPGREVVSNRSEGKLAREDMQSQNKYDWDQIDEEEKTLDNLWINYVNKKQPHESSKVKENLNHHQDQESDDTSRVTRHRSKRSDNYAEGPKHRHASGNVYPSPRYGSDDATGGRTDRRAKSELPHQPARATSVPSEPAAGHEGTRGKQSEMDCGLGHVHPRLPDYNDLAAQLAALGGK